MEVVVLQSRGYDLVEFVFVLSLYLNRRRWFFDLRGESVDLISREQGEIVMGVVKF